MQTKDNVTEQSERTMLVPVGSVVEVEEIGAPFPHSFKQWLILALCSALCLTLFSYGFNLFGLGFGDYLFWVIYLLLVIALFQNPLERTCRSKPYWLGVIVFVIGASSLPAGCVVLNSMIVSLPIMLGVELTTIWALLIPQAIYYLVMFLAASAAFIGALMVAGYMRAPYPKKVIKGLAELLLLLIVAALFASLCTILNGLLEREKAGIDFIDIVFSVLYFFGLFFSWGMFLNRAGLGCDGVISRHSFRITGTVGILAVVFACAGAFVMVCFPEMYLSSITEMLWALTWIGQDILTENYQSLDEIWSITCAEYTTFLIKIGLEAIVFLGIGLVVWICSFLKNRSESKRSIKGLPSALSIALFALLCCEGINLVLYRCSTLFADDGAYMQAIDMANTIVVPIALFVVVIAIFWVCSDACVAKEDGLNTDFAKGAEQQSETDEKKQASTIAN